MTADLINGLFETFGGVAVAFSIRAILKDKKSAGFSIIPLLFFTSWGYWNLYYYPHLNQWFSAFGALATVAANTLYIGLVIKYRYWRQELKKVYDLQESAHQFRGHPLYVLALSDALMEEVLILEEMEGIKLGRT